MTDDKKLLNGTIPFARLLWRFKTTIILFIIASSAVSTASYLIFSDYLDHRKDRSEAIEVSHKIIKKEEAKLGALFDRTTPLWKRGEPIPADLIQELATSTSELYSAIEGLSNPTAQTLKASFEFRDAVARLRNSVVSYQHNEKTVRALYSAIDVYAENRDIFHSVVEKQIEDYSKTLIGLF